MCEHAAKALGMIGDPRAVESLINRLSKHGGAGAARALGEIGDEGAIGPLISAISDKNEVMRDAAIRALGKIGPLSIESLKRALVVRGPDREAVADALIRLDWKPDKSEAGLAYRIARRDWFSCVDFGDSAVDVLIGALKEGDAHAAFALGQIGSKRAVEPLIEALENKNSEARQSSAKALGGIADLSSVGPLINYLEKYGEKAAACALGMIGDPRAKEPLINYLLKEGEGEAAIALDKLGWHPENAEIAEKYSIAKAKYWIEHRKWFECLEIGEPAVNLLIQHLKEGYLFEGDFGAIIRVIGKIGSPQAVDYLLSLFSIAWSDREAIADALGNTKDFRVVEKLISMFRNEYMLGPELDPMNITIIRGLKEITGEDLGRFPARWKEWWEENKGKFLKEQ